MTHVIYSGPGRDLRVDGAVRALGLAGFSELDALLNGVAVTLEERVQTRWGRTRLAVATNSTIGVLAVPPLTRDSEFSLVAWQVVERKCYTRLGLTRTEFLRGLDAHPRVAVQIWRKHRQRRNTDWGSARNPWLVGEITDLEAKHTGR